jgi:hypothetical protein
VDLHFIFVYVLFIIINDNTIRFTRNMTNDGSESGGRGGEGEG